MVNLIIVVIILVLKLNIFLFIKFLFLIGIEKNIEWYVIILFICELIIKFKIKF